jgi:hypothetical protein
LKKIDIFYNELNSKDKLDFISAYYAKHHNLYGVPRLIIKKDKKIKTQDLTQFFLKPASYFKEIDDKFFPLIEDELDQSEYIVIFDRCQLSFLESDELFQFLPDKLRKKFNLNLRHQEKNKFLSSNENHLKNNHLIVTQSIKDKLNAIWSSKWNNSKSYLNDFDFLIIDNIC